MIARGAPSWIVAPFLLEAAAVWVYALAPSPIALVLLVPTTTVLTLLGVGLLYFFRDPRREIGEDVVSPADGRVLAADPVANSVSIFMNLHDVHVNRAPLGGVIAKMEYTPGTHARADREEARENERLSTKLRTALGDLHMVQYSGAVARRIVPYVRVGDRVRKGQRIGLIRLGSRVELRLPPGLHVDVAAGERVRAGETTIARVVR
ncbi:MAG TPA: phosphatidylserine decarboxylase [Thermoplasmata archaeon]|nr:phosphatidylserine decarboxylase [Thermoplasmata archaeon]